MGKLPDAPTAEAFARFGQQMLQGLAQLPFPVVCAIHGACAGGGYELALACDVRLASDAPETNIGLTETGIGTIPGWGGSVRLPRLIGAEAALEHIVNARLLPAGQALADKLVDEVVPAAELKASAKALAIALSGKGKASRRAPAAPAKTSTRNFVSDPGRMPAVSPPSCNRRSRWSNRAPVSMRKRRC